MPVATPRFEVKPWNRPAQTKEELDWAPLRIIDLSTFDEPGGKEKLAAELADSVKNVGFWMVTGTDIEDSETLRQLSIANAFFQQPLEEKRKHPCDFKTGYYFGYREPVRTIGETGVKENVEMLNIPKYTKNNDYKDVSKHDLILAYEEEIAAFQRKLFDNVTRKLFVLLSLILELPENYLLDRHAYDDRSEDHLRYASVFLSLPEDSHDNANGYRWSITLAAMKNVNLLMTNVAGLQIKTPQGDWKYVKPVPGAITVNSADVLTFLTKGYIKSTIHRVVGPPADQSHVDRLGLLYFVRPGDEVPIVPVPSPLLEREGLLNVEDKKITEKDAVKGYEWVRARVSNAHNQKVLNFIGIPGSDGLPAKFNFRGLEVDRRVA